MTDQELATELVNAWVGYLRGREDPEHYDEAHLERFIDLTAIDHGGTGLPEEVDSEGIRSSFVLINMLTEAQGRGLAADEEDIVRDTLGAAMRALGNRVGVEVPDIASH